MNKFFVLLISILIAELAIVSCGGSSGGGSASGGIGGTGIFSSGRISANGSVVVNGVQYDTDGAIIIMDGETVSDDSMLKVGMIVEIEGTVNDDGVTGSANEVRFDDSVEGPVDAIDLTTRQLQVLGQTVQVDDLTIFDDGSISPPNLTGLDPGDIVEVSGQLDSMGIIRATHIEQKAASITVEVTGFVTAKSGNTFMINSLTVDFSTAQLDDFGGGEPENGDFVEVKGAVADYNPGTTTLIASRVEQKNQDAEDGLEAEVEGFIDSLTGSGFTVVTPSGRFVIEVDGSTVYSGGVFSDLQIGTKVEVEGQIVGGNLLADKVKFKDNVRIEIAAAGADGSTLTLDLRLLPSLTVRVDSLTRIEDKRDSPSATNDPGVFLDSINMDDAIKLRGRLVGSDVLATELEVDDPESDLDRVDLRGPVDSDPTDLRFLQIVGILIDTGVTGTSFQDINENSIDRATFFSSVTAGSLVDVRGDLNPLGDQIDAEELELED